MANAGEYKDKRLVSVESSNIAADKPDNDATQTMSQEDQEELMKWMEEIYTKERVVEIKPSSRLVNHPAVVTDFGSASMRRMMRMIDKKSASTLPPQTLEVNLNHPIMCKLNSARIHDPEFAREAALQVFDNALASAGLLDDPRTMLARLNLMLERALDGPMDGPSN